MDLLKSMKISASGLRANTKRIEAIEPFDADGISARALASLDKLLNFSQSFATEKTTFLFFI